MGIKESWAKEPANCKDMVDFLNWFDATKSVADTLKQAQKDWDERIIKFDGFNALSKTTSLEIGFGAGRLLVPASKLFETVMGADIHNAFNRSREFLKASGVTNYQLLRRDQLSILARNSIDFIYSFIVFQHFDSFGEVDFYLDEIKRLLRPNGVAHLFYGKGAKEVETVDSSRFTKRSCSLFVQPQFFRQYLSDRGFMVLEYDDVLPKNLNKPVSKKNESGQARVLFKVG